VEHIGASEDFAKELHQMAESLHNNEGEGVHIDGSPHHFVIQVSWICPQCGHVEMTEVK
jgi:rubrerythrin